MATEAYYSLKNGLKAGIAIVRNGLLTIHEGVLPEAIILPDQTLFNKINSLN
jgi:hypothetical protein